MDDISKLQENLDILKDRIAKERGKKEKLLEQLATSKEQAEELEKKLDLLDQVIVLFQKTSEFAREQAKAQIESLVTKCLQFIFDSDVKFQVEIKELRNKANAEFYVVTETEDMIIKTKPELSRGGGVVDIVSLALRIAFLEIHKPRITGPLILDEPAKHVSEEYIFNVGNFLKQSSIMFNRQIIMITHDQHLAAIGDKGYRIALDGTVSTLSQIEN